MEICVDQTMTRRALIGFIKTLRRPGDPAIPSTKAALILQLADYRLRRAQELRDQWNPYESEERCPPRE